MIYAWPHTACTLRGSITDHAVRGNTLITISSPTFKLYTSLRFTLSLLFALGVNRAAEQISRHNTARCLHLMQHWAEAHIFHIALRGRIFDDALFTCQTCRQPFAFHMLLVALPMISFRQLRCRRDSYSATHRPPGHYAVASRTGKQVG